MTGEFLVLDANVEIPRGSQNKYELGLTNAFGFSSDGAGSYFSMS
jgi:hypothetical protein